MNVQQKVEVMKCLREVIPDLSLFDAKHCVDEGCLREEITTNKGNKRKPTEKEQSDARRIVHTVESCLDNEKSDKVVSVQDVPYELIEQQVNFIRNKLQFGGVDKVIKEVFPKDGNFTKFATDLALSRSMMCGSTAGEMAVIDVALCYSIMQAQRQCDALSKEIIW